MEAENVLACKTQHELTAFVREVLLPGSSDAMPQLDSRFCFFKLDCKGSQIHRWGIFAAENIPAERKVIEYTGEKIDVREVLRRSIRQHLYLFWLNEDRTTAIDGAIGGSGAEFINHSCAPNLETDNEDGRLFLSSRRRIRMGEELTLDYNLDKEGAILTCSCGSKNCRGFINRL